MRTDVHYLTLKIRRPMATAKRDPLSLGVREPADTSRFFARAPAACRCRAHDSGIYGGTERNGAVRVRARQTINRIHSPTLDTICDITRDILD